jgi:hypothetical protein
MKAGGPGTGIKYQLGWGLLRARKPGYLVAHETIGFTNIF